MPTVRTIETASGAVGLAHADVPHPDWAVAKAMLDADAVLSGSRCGHLRFQEPLGALALFDALAVLPASPQNVEHASFLSGIQRVQQSERCGDRWFQGPYPLRDVQGAGAS